MLLARAQDAATVTQISSKLGFLSLFLTLLPVPWHWIRIVAAGKTAYRRQLSL